MQMEAARSVASRIAIQRPEFSEILDRVRKLRPDIDARALATEKARRVPAETMEALRAADVFRIMQPYRFGGYEYGPPNWRRSASSSAAPAAAPAGAARWRCASVG